MDAESPGGEHENLTPGYYAGQLAGKSDAWIAVYLAAEYGRLPAEGACFAGELAELERAGRICDLSASPDLPVHTFWDLGVADFMAIWFGQNLGGAWHFVDYYENHGQAIDHYARTLSAFAAARRWTWGEHVWPHDGGRRDAFLSGAQFRSDVFVNLGFRAPLIMPRRRNPGEWIDPARLFLRGCRFDRAACKAGLAHLRKYRQRRDEARGVFQNVPHHDEHSHAADAFQLAAVSRTQVSNKSAVWSDAVMNFALPVP